MGKKFAIFVADSGNRKLGNVAATYATLDSCPSDCAWRGEGCYAETGYVGIVSRRLAGPGIDPRTVARQEARLIREGATRAPRGRGLRVHVAGDARTNTAARILAGAATVWRRATGVRPWSYTHAWSRVDRESWGPDISVLASVETSAQGVAAVSRGYVPAIVVGSFPRGPKPFRLDEEGPSYIPCPAQTRGRTCSQCRLCWSESTLKGRGIAFQAHGSGTSKVVRKLVVLNREGK